MNVQCRKGIEGFSDVVDLWAVCIELVSERFTAVTKRSGIDEWHNPRPETRSKWLKEKHHGVMLTVWWICWSLSATKLLDMNLMERIHPEGQWLRSTWMKGSTWIPSPIDPLQDIAASINHGDSLQTRSMKALQRQALQNESWKSMHTGKPAKMSAFLDFHCPPRPAWKILLLKLMDGRVRPLGANSSQLSVADLGSRIWPFFPIVFHPISACLEVCEKILCRQLGLYS